MSDNRSSFFSLLEQRLAEGAKTYGFAEQPGGDPRPLLELYGELQQELVDIAGWGKLAFDKIESMKANLRAAELSPTRMGEALREVEFWKLSYSDMYSSYGDAEKRLAERKALIEKLEAKVLATEARNRDLEAKLAAIKADTKRWLDKL